jgi:hypothetical protein
MVEEAVALRYPDEDLETIEQMTQLCAFQTRTSKRVSK